MVGKVVRYGRVPLADEVMGRPLVRVGVDADLPLMGCIAFGVIDRGTNLIQVRPVSYCPLSCIFCSTDAGPKSRWRRAEYYVPPDLLIEWVKALVKLKEPHPVEAHVDTVGEPLTYYPLPDLIQELKSIPNVKVVSMQTHGSVLTIKYASRLAAAGLDRINLSIDTINPEKARYLQGTDWYDVRRVMEVTEWILRNTETDVMLAPLLLPGINDGDVEEVIEWGKRVGVGKRYPGYGIQIYLRHKHGRKPKGIKIMTIKQFHRLLKHWEVKHGVKLILSEEDFGIRPAPTPPIMFRVGQKVKVRIRAPGWLRNEWLATPVGRFKEARTITVIDTDNTLEVGSKVTVRIIHNKHNIYLSVPT